MYMCHHHYSAGSFKTLRLLIFLSFVALTARANSDTATATATSSATPSLSSSARAS